MLSLLGNRIRPSHLGESQRSCQEPDSRMMQKKADRCFAILLADNF
jgi:hypothetical protein